eukprot:GFUD01012015.1.p1 GENE.GFUD01012015.1~~GFUD01012015.1.p1  ORF type:complete len:175 (+),score=74.97 GFUD01012015.1:79-603(+)
MFKRGADPVKLLLVGGMVYMVYSYWYLSTYNMMYINKIVDLERKISAIRLSRDDELKNVVVLETRLRTSKEDQQRIRQKLNTMEDTSSEYQRIQREVGTLRSKLVEFKEQADKCLVDQDDLQDCQSGRDLMTRELEGREEAIHRLKEKMKLYETKLKKLGMMEAKIHQMEKGPH